MNSTKKNWTQIELEWYKKFSIINIPDLLKCGLIAGKTKRLWLNGYCHCKFYMKSKDDNGRKKQLFRNDKIEVREVPYERRLFHNSSARFSLIDKPVCYIAPDIITAMIETTPEFRKEQNVDLLREKIKKWIDGNYNPDKNKMGYPKNNISIRQGANILDLRDNDPCVCRFYNLFEKYELSISSDRFYKEIVNKKNPKSYEITRALAEFAHENGFNGIRYKSTHAIDNNKNNDIIVIFDSKFIEEK